MFAGSPCRGYSGATSTSLVPPNVRGEPYSWGVENRLMLAMSGAGQKMLEFEGPASKLAKDAAADPLHRARVEGLV